ncbi:MAG: PEBP family protein [Candidatus Peregrinibacteria bacterium GW2011_GWF2_33_10]|nr:MAG: PEBP family protein [Candidatus Peregrinibacteria bacterium GW2011_GWF2_33_10]
MIFIITLMFLSCSQETTPDDSQSNLLPFTISSSAFNQGEYIPVKYTCDGENISPSLNIVNIPAKTKNLALIMEDPDAPRGNWMHWLVVNINTNTTQISENGVPYNAFQGMNSGGRNQYDGPCPPSGTHRYFFRLYALDSDVSLDKLDESRFKAAIADHIIAETEFYGIYGR